MRKFMGYTLVAVAVIALVLAGMAFSTALLYYAWSWVVPGVFGGPALTWKAAFGVVCLLSILGNLLRSSDK